MVVPPQPPWQSRGGARVSQRHKNRAFRRWYLLAFNRDAWFSWGRLRHRPDGPMKRNVPWPERGGIPLKGGRNGEDRRMEGDLCYHRLLCPQTQRGWENGRG